MRRILWELLIVAVETIAILGMVAAFGVPGGKRTTAEAVFDIADRCPPVKCDTWVQSDDFFRPGSTSPD